MACRVDQGDAAAAWLSDYLGEGGLRLVRMDEKHCRPTDPDYGQGYVMTYADKFPLLLCSEESLNDLNDKLKTPAPMIRFRPNVVVKGLPAWQEDEWTRVTIGGLKFGAVHPCSRCQIPDIDQARTFTYMHQLPFACLELPSPIW